MMWIRYHFPWRAVLSVVGLVALSLILALALGRIDESADEQGYAALEQNLRRAAVHCYAVEGRYPPNLEYLTENYGITIDTSRYTVYYTPIGSNLMPDITVLDMSATDWEEALGG